MHEVVNGANGSVTWCQGLNCQRCTETGALNLRIKTGGAIRLGDGIDVMPPWGYRIIGVGTDRL